MQFFDNFGEENMEKDTKLNLLEKTTVFALTSYIIAVAKKARKAKTYDDLIKIMNKVETFLDATSEELEERKKGSEEDIKKMIQALEDETTVLTHLKQ